MNNKKGSGCAAPIIAFLVIMGISVLLQAIWTPTISDFNVRMEMTGKISTYGWIAAIVIPLIIFIVGLIREKKEKEYLLRQDIINSRKRANEQIIKLNATYYSGDKSQLAVAFDHAVDLVWASHTISGAYEYMRTIETANFLYCGNKYTQFRNPNVFLEEVISEEIKHIPDSHFKG